MDSINFNKTALIVGLCLAAGSILGLYLTRPARGINVQAGGKIEVQCTGNSAVYINGAKITGDPIHVVVQDGQEKILKGTITRDEEWSSAVFSCTLIVGVFIACVSVFKK